MALNPKNHALLEELAEIIDTHLTALKFFPGGAGSVAVARLVAKLVDSIEEARQLCEAIVQECDEWPGPATLRHRYLNQFHPERIFGRAPEYKPEPIQCTACQDWGRRRDLDGKWVACQCTPDFPPRLLELMNRPAAAGRGDGRKILAPGGLKVVTQADIDLALAARAAERAPAAIETKPKE